MSGKLSFGIELNKNSMYKFRNCTATLSLFRDSVVLFKLIHKLFKLQNVFPKGPKTLHTIVLATKWVLSIPNGMSSFVEAFLSLSF